MSLLNAVLDRISVKNEELYNVQRAIDSGIEQDFLLPVKYKLTSVNAPRSLYIPVISTKGHFQGKS